MLDIIYIINIMLRKVCSKYFYMHSFKPNQISQALQAVWAEAVFKEIVKLGELKQNADKIITEPLVDHLQSQKFHLSVDSLKKLQELGYKKQTVLQEKQKFFKIFDPFQGAKLPLEIIASQKRFTSALNSNLKISFYPNSYITPRIFKAIDSNKYFEKNQMIIARPGTSKSMGFIFAWYLSSLITDFKLTNKQQSKKFVEHNLLDQKSVKIIYFNWKAIDPQMNDLINYFKVQCPQVKNEFETAKIGNNLTLTTSINLGHFLLDIKNMYLKENIFCLVVNDQINTLARNFHQYNQYELMKKNGQKLQGFQKQALKRTEKLRLIYEAFINSKMNKIYNSSRNIEEKLLGRSLLSQNIFLTLCLNDHSMIFENECQITENQISSKQISRFIWYQAAKKIDPSPFSDEKRKQLRKMYIRYCDQQASKRIQMSLVTPESIKLSLQRINKTYPVCEQQKIKNFVIQVAQTIERQGLELLDYKSNKFLAEESNQKIRNSKYQVTLFFWEELQKDPIATKVNLKSLELRGLRQDIINQYLNKDLFKMKVERDAKNNETISYELTINRKHYNKIQFKWIVSELYSPSLFLMNFVYQHQPTLGVFIEYSILQWIILNNKSKFLVGGEEYNIQSAHKFLHFFQKQVPWNNCLKTIFDKASQNQPQNYSFGWPTVDLETDEISTNNPSFDLIGVRGNKQEGFQITSFDFTVVNEKAKIQTKVKNAKYWVSKFLLSEQKYPKSESSIKLEVISTFLKILENRNKMPRIIWKENNKQRTKDEVFPEINNYLQQFTKIDTRKHNEIVTEVKEYIENGKILMKVDEKIEELRVENILARDQDLNVMKNQILTHLNQDLLPDIKIKMNQNVLKCYRQICDPKNEKITKWNHYIVCRQQFLKEISTFGPANLNQTIFKIKLVALKTVQLDYWPGSMISQNLNQLRQNLKKMISEADGV